MICMMSNVKLFLLFIIISLYVSDNSENAFHPHPSPISHIEPCNILVASRSMPPFHITYNLDLFYLIKFIFLIFLWVPYLLLDITCIKERFVNFKSSLSILAKRYRNNILASETMQVWVYLYMFFILLEYFLTLLCLTERLHYVFQAKSPC